MKKILVAILVVIGVMSGSAQERVNGFVNYYTNQSQILKKAIGWAYNTSNGQWVSHKNMLSPFKMCSAMSWGYYDNFNKIQIKQITYNDTNYYAVFIRYTGGAYKYPYIEEDFYQISEVYIMLINEENYNKLFDLDNNIYDIKGLKVYCGVLLNDNDQDMYKYVLSKIQYLKEEFLLKTFLKIYKSRDEKIRFLIDMKDCRIIIKNTNDIDQRYYEVSEDEWNKLKI